MVEINPPLIKQLKSTDLRQQKTFHCQLRGDRMFLITIRVAMECFWSPFMW
jgi:hypothetical protein